jgi:DNA polymerase-1
LSLYNGVLLPGKPDIENIRRIDLMILPQIIRMNRVGIQVNVPYLQATGSEFAARMAVLQKDISSYIPPDKLALFADAAAAIEEEGGSATINAASADQIRALLFDLLDVGRGKKLKVTSTGALSTGKKNIDLCRDAHPVVPLVQQYRELSKLKSAFCDALPRLALNHPKGNDCPICELSHVEPTTRLHTTFTTTRAITGRLSSRLPNLQQIPIRTPEGARIRAAFEASRGKMLVSRDLSHMEIRDLAHLANASSLIKVYEAGGDVHLDTAMKAFGITDPAKVDKYLHRLPAKRTNFGVQNGTTGKGLLAQLVGDYWAAGIQPPSWLTESWCDQFIIDWHKARPEVQPYFETQYNHALRYGFVWNPWGRFRRIPQVRSTLSWKRSEGLREAQNFAVTSSNAEQIKLIMAASEEFFDNLRMAGIYCEALLSIHDQLIVEVDEYYAEMVNDNLEPLFNGVMDDYSTGERYWRCPITSDGEVLKQWKTLE